MNIKTPLIATGTLIIVLLIFMFAIAGILPAVMRQKVAEMTPEKAQKLLQAAGGVDEINREAKIIFTKSDANKWTFLPDQDLDQNLTDVHAVYSLYTNLECYSGTKYSGTSVAVFPEDGRHIEIKFGNHWSLKRFYIFDPDAPVTFDLATNEFQVTSNIFASK
jgi:hypothetical protein